MFFFSCETEGQITGSEITPDQDQYDPSDVDGNGMSIGNISELYFDLNSTESYNQNFWKFNYTHYSSPPQIHCGPTNYGVLCNEYDIFNLQTYNNSFYVPPEAFDPNAGTIVYVYNENYDPNNPLSEEYIPSVDYDELSDLTTEINVETEVTSITSEIMLKTPPISISTDPIEKITWSIGENMYSYTTMTPIRDTVTFEYEYEYDLMDNFVPLDTLQNPILDDVVVVLDTTEIGDSSRFYEVFDTVSTNNETIPVLINREHVFYSYINEINDDYSQRQSTDCNDNYQKDPAELTLNYFENLCESNGGIWQSNSNDLCNSVCSIDGLTMYELCWEEFIDDLRLTGHCAVDATVGVAFCDTGNNLYDEGEVLYDACFGDCDGENGNIDVIGQGVEPWEDRNCNLTYDNDSEEILAGINTQNDCNSITFSSWDSNENVCFYDRGNGQWDDEETCYGDFSSCDYTGLYKKGFAPNYLLVNYADQNNPVPLTSIFAGDVYKDCGSDMLCNEFEFGYDPGTCDDGFSGTEELCCKHNLCWDYNTNSCDWSLATCTLPISGGWSENLDPSGDDCTNCPVSNGGIPNGEERNFQYDSGEFLIKDFDGDQAYSSADTFVTKELNYSDCPQNPNNCGGDEFEIISDQFESSSSSESIQKLNAEVEVSSYGIVGQIPNMSLGNLNIVKTQWPDDGEPDGESEDYMLFIDTEGLVDDEGFDYISKLIQPYFYYANTPYTAFPTDYIDYDHDKWWQQLDWEEDRLLYALDGDIYDGQRKYTTYTVESDTANYVVHKEYDVSIANADMTYDTTVEDCILITRTITLTMVGPAFDYKFRSQTYLKEDYPIVKEVISWSWPPTFGADRSWAKISAIEYCDPQHPEHGDACTGDNVFLNNGNNFISHPQPINLRNLQEYQIFDYEPFKISKTLGLQRFVAPEE